MSRPIKYMAWDKEIGELLSVRSIDWDNHGSIEVQLECRTEYYGSFEVDLYQFTGLLDKDGKEIYEGSVVEWNNTKTEILWDEDCPGYIFGNDIPGQHGMECLDEETAKTMKIIGHIAEEGKDG